MSQVAAYPVLYSRDLYLERCKKHLFEAKGTYEYTEKLKDLILLDVARRMENLLNDFLSDDPATKSLAQALTNWADDSRKRDRLATVFVIRKLIKKANAQGVGSRPMSNNIGYLSLLFSHFYYKVGDASRGYHL